jgi:hypothetical protein
MGRIMEKITNLFFTCKENPDWNSKSKRWMNLGTIAALIIRAAL